MMRRPVRTDHARTVDGEHHVELRQRHVDDHLVDSALQERGVDGHDRLLAAGGQAARIADRVLLGDARVHEAQRVLLGEGVKSGAAAHGGGDGDDAVVLARLLDQGFPKHVRVLGGGGTGRLHHFAGCHAVRRDAVELFRVAHGGHVALALVRDHVHEHRAVGGKHGAQHLAQMRDIVAVERGRAHDAELFEDHGMRNDELLHRFLHVAPDVGERLAHGARAFQMLLHVVARLTVLRGRAHGAEVLHERADVVRDGHLVVVEDDDHGRLGLPDVVERLERHAAGQRRVADERDHLLVGAGQIARLRQAERDRQRVGRMPGEMRVVRTFGRLRESGQATVGAQRVEALEPTRHQLVRIGLMPHVEDDVVLRAVELGMQGQDDLHRAERRGHMPARLRRGRDDFLANLARQYRELLVGEELQVGGAGNHVQYALIVHAMPFEHDALCPCACIMRRRRRRGPLLR